MEGTGTQAEETLQRINKLNSNLNNTDHPENTADRINYTGEIGCQDVPDIDKIEIDTETYTPATNTDSRTFQNVERTNKLESVYSTLFGEGGYEILRELEEGETIHNPNQMGNFSYPETLTKMEELGLTSETSTTEMGEIVYQNWQNLENHLSSPERLQDIEEEIGEMQMPEFLRLCGVNVEDTDTYLRRKDFFTDRWAVQHDGEVEIYMITDVLYSEDQSPGDNLRLLEDVKKGDVDTPEGYENVGIRGISSEKASENLNTDGEKIYGNVLADYIHF